MPLVNIRLTRRDQPTTREQKAALIAGVTQLMQDVLAKRADSVVVIIDEIDPDNWGEGGESVTVLRQRRTGQAPRP
ncbi:MAG: 4-oxalocrotonate tautomerase [Rhodoferax sp.]|nr:4-oxalocrotonate tautomerase [Rhodoferax sp.]